MEIDINNIKAAYDTATDTEKKLLNTLFPDLHIGKDTRPVTERIKTFEDAYCALGNEHPFVRAYEKYVNDDGGEERDVIAYLKLRIIVTALNEGWRPKFSKEEYRWWPYFRHYYTEQISEMADDSTVHTACCPSASAGDCVFVSVGSWLVFKTKELADYAGKQFIDIYADFMLGWELKR